MKIFHMKHEDEDDSVCEMLCNPVQARGGGIMASPGVNSGIVPHTQIF